MASIDIQHAHSLGLAKARRAVDALAAQLSERFGVTHHWEGDTLHFARSGVEGRVALFKDALHVQAKLGLLFGAMKGTIEHELRALLEKHFG